MKHLMTTAAIAALALTACGQADTDYEADNETLETTPIVDGAADDMKVTETDPLLSRTFNVQNSSGYDIGEVTILDTEDGVELMLDVTSIPEGSHAIHFHENGTCDGPDFTSAGGHYAPASNSHGFEVGDGPHAGDMRNFDAPQSGLVETTIMNDRVSLSDRKGFAPLFDSNGTALIIHAAADDYKSQPSGAAGARIACAVITAE